MSARVISDDQLDDRDRRALLEDLLVVKKAPGIYGVYAETGHEYIVDAANGCCTCPDFHYRNEKCKHVRRIEIEIDERKNEAILTDIEAALDEIDREIEELATKRAELIRLQRIASRFQ